MVIDVFIDSHWVGHETAVQLKDYFMKTMETKQLDVRKLVGLSRDSPQVMEATLRLITEEAERAGNPKLFSMPDFLHPSHTSFEKLLLALKHNVPGSTKDFLARGDLDKLLTTLQPFFKQYAGRREDMSKLREAMEEENPD